MLSTAISCFLFNLKFNQKKTGTLLKHQNSTQYFLSLQTWMTYFLLWEYTVNYRLHEDLIAPHQTQQTDSFLFFPAFQPMGFYFTQAEKKLKYYRDQGRLTFLAPRHHTPSHWVALLFSTLVHDSKVSLLAGYPKARNNYPSTNTYIADYCG